MASKKRSFSGGSGGLGLAVLPAEGWASTIALRVKVLG